jgi:hypothetical protein
MTTDNADLANERNRNEEIGTWPSGQSAGKWSMWCADCGQKNHIHADKCSCGSDAFVEYSGNIGKPEYTSGDTDER